MGRLAIGRHEPNKRNWGPPMNCKTHTDVAAENRCTGCAESFCGNCLVEIKGQNYCGECKSLALEGAAPVMPEEATLPCELAGESLKYAIIGLFCFGIILGPMAISKGLEAKKQMAANPQLTGMGKANAGIAIGAICLIFWLLGVVARVGGG